MLCDEEAYAAGDAGEEDLGRMEAGVRIYRVLGWRVAIVEPGDYQPITTMHMLEISQFSTNSYKKNTILQFANIIPQHSFVFTASSSNIKMKVT